MKIKYISLITFTTILAYFSSLHYYFSQDDFIILFSSQANSFQAFLNLFNPFAHFPDIFFYRPLSSQLYYFLNQSLFGLNPLPFHLEALLLQIINSYLVFTIVKKIWKKDSIALLSGVFYGISAVHFLSLFYISAFSEILRTFFMLGSVLYFLKYRQSSKPRFWIYSLIAFIGALLSKETSIILPLLFFPLEIIRQPNKDWKKTLMDVLKITSPFFVILAIYFGIRFVGFQTIFGQGDYQTTFSPEEIFQNLKWYILWILGLPEVLSSYPSLRPASLFQFGHDLPFGFWVLGLFGITVGFLVTIFSLNIKQIKKTHLKTFSMIALFCLISLAPVLVLHGHRYPHYLDISLLLILPVISFSIITLYKRLKILAIIFIVIFCNLQILSLKLSEQTHWTTHRSRVAEFYHQDLSQKLGKITSPMSVVFVGSPSDLQGVSVALGKQYAAKLWFPQVVKSVSYSEHLSSAENSIMEKISIH